MLGSIRLRSNFSIQIFSFPHFEIFPDSAVVWVTFDSCFYGCLCCSFWEEWKSRLLADTLQLLSIPTSLKLSCEYCLTMRLSTIDFNPLVEWMQVRLWTIFCLKYLFYAYVFKFSSIIIYSFFAKIPHDLGILSLSFQISKYYFFLLYFQFWIYQCSKIQRINLFLF